MLPWSRAVTPASGRKTAWATGASGPVGRSDALIQTTAGFRTRRSVLDGDSASQSERVQSLIPVLPWQTGYSYYNNYSSKQTAYIPPSKLASDEFSVQDDLSETERIRLIERLETIQSADQRLRVSGIFGKYASDGVAMTESVFERHGLWNIITRDQVAAMQDTLGQQHGRRAYLRSDSVSMSVFLPPFKFRWDESFSVSDSAEQHGKRAYAQSDNPALTERWLLNGKRSLTRTDGVTMIDSGWQRGLRVRLLSEQFGLIDVPAQSGKRARVHSDTVTLESSAYVRGGVRAWKDRENVLVSDSSVAFLRRVEDSAEFAETYSVHGRFAKSSTIDTVGLQERLRWDTPLARQNVALTEQPSIQFDRAVRFDQVVMAETGSVNSGLIKRDSALLGEAFLINGTRVWTASELLTLAENTASKRDKDATRKDTYTLDERWSRAGRLAIKASDSAALADRSLNRWIKLSEAVSLGELGAIKRLEWRERVVFTDVARLEQAIRVALRGESFGLLERASLSGFPSDVTVTDGAGLSESAYRLTGGGSERIKFTEQWDLRGRLSLSGVEGVMITERWENRTATPYQQDLISAADSRLTLHGRIALLRSDQVSGTLISAQQHGLRALRYYDGVISSDRFVDPRGKLGKDSFSFLETGLGVARREDYVQMRESWVRDATTTVITMYDWGRQHVKLKPAKPEPAEQVILTDSGWANNSLEQRLRIRVLDRRELSRDVGLSASEYRMTERGKLFRSTDFLQPLPDMYDERPGRRRSAVRLVQDAAQQTWAVWLSQGGTQVSYARRPSQGSWFGHSVVSLPVPFEGARSVTLVFKGGLPVPVVEAQARVYTLSADQSTWSSVPGLDPVTLGTKLCWMSTDRYTLHTPSGDFSLGQRGRAVQGFDGGVLVEGDLGDRLIELGELPAKQPEPDEEIASVRWHADQDFSETYIPIEGTVTLD